VDELAIEICKAKKRLNVFNFARFRPILDDLDFGGVHQQASRRKYITKIFDGIGMESAFLCSSVKSIFLETSEYLSDMFAMKFRIVGIDENVIKVNYYANVEHVGEDVIHEPLEGGWSICESKWHYLPFK